MPFIDCLISAGDYDKAALSKELATVVHEVTGAPLAVTMVHVHAADTLAFAESTDPACCITLHTIGGHDKSADLVARLTEVAAKVGKVDSARVFFIFNDHARTHWGFKGAMLA